MTTTEIIHLIIWRKKIYSEPKYDSWCVPLWIRQFPTFISIEIRHREKYYKILSTFVDKKSLSSASFGKMWSSVGHLSSCWLCLRFVQLIHIQILRSDVEWLLLMGWNFKKMAKERRRLSIGQITRMATKTTTCHNSNINYVCIHLWAKRSRWSSVQGAGTLLAAPLQLMAR